MPSDPLWINASAGSPAYDAAELRRAFAMLLQQGGTGDRFGARAGVHPAGSNVVSLSGTTITVLDTKAVVYPGHSSSAGPYLVHLASRTHTLTAANPSNPRKDIVYLRVWDDAEDLSGLRKADTEYLAGTAAASPVEPTLPAGALKLATIDVPANNTAGSTLTYNAAFTVALGGILPVRNDAELTGSATGLYDGMARWRRDTNELQVHSGGSTWETVAGVDGYDSAVNPPSCRVYNDANQSLASTDTPTYLTFNSEDFDSGGMHSTSSNTGRITFAKAGVYLVGCNIRLTPATDYIVQSLRFRKNGTTEIAINIFIPGGATTAHVVELTTLYKFAASDYVQLGVSQRNSAAASRNVEISGELSPRFWAVYQGTGA